ncbi:monocarboxylate transporter 6 isoform X6 [Macaca fascicularis]|uniref:monocarboxylate transporter 6 isoform X6 n=1 Tax=Macaca fascicularis TaxID=9541 RepID=UPI003D158661
MPQALERADGSWAWVVLLATMVTQGLTLGFPTCIGIFFTDLQWEFQASNSQTSWIPSILMAVLHMAGPLCSILVGRFGCRVTTMLGGVLASLGMVASSFSRNLSQLYFTAGFITGSHGHRPYGSVPQSPGTLHCPGWLCFPHLPTTGRVAPGRHQQLQLCFLHVQLLPYLSCPLHGWQLLCPAEEGAGQAGCRGRCLGAGYFLGSQRWSWEAAVPCDHVCNQRLRPRGHLCDQCLSPGVTE